MKKLFLLFPVLISNLVYAQSWEYVAISDTGVRYFIDMVSIKRTGSEVKFTQLSNHSDGFKYDSKLVYSIVTHRTANCVKNEYKPGFLFAYPELYAQGEIQVVDLKNDTKWISVTPESIASFMQDRVCSRAL
jgi:hypothetical protein